MYVVILEYATNLNLNSLLLDTLIWLYYFSEVIVLIWKQVDEAVEAELEVGVEVTEVEGGI